VQNVGEQLDGTANCRACDNEVSTIVINHGRARSKFLNACARELLFVAAIREFNIRAR
jgi:hypothetical protein